MNLLISGRSRTVDIPRHKHCSEQIADFTILFLKSLKVLIVSFRGPICIILALALSWGFFLYYNLLPCENKLLIESLETQKHLNLYQSSPTKHSSVKNYCPSDLYQKFSSQINSSSSILIFQDSLWWRRYNYSGVQLCSHLPMKCEWTMDRAKYDKADAVAYHFAEVSYHIPRVPVLVNANKLSIGVCREAFFNHLHHYYPTKNESSRWQYNVSATHQLTSDIPYTYFNMQALITGLKKRTIFNEMQPGATFISSHCRSFTQRVELSQLLENYIPVYYFGKCLNNIEWPSDIHENDVVGVMGRYMLNFAFENSNSEDYVTEKLFHALASGAIPVFHGTNTIDKFLPSPDSIIRVADFPSVEALGKFLKKVISNKDLFDSYHVWRYRALPKSLKERFEFTEHSLLCRTCRYVYARKFGCFWDQKKQQIGGLLAKHLITEFLTL